MSIEIKTLEELLAASAPKTVYVLVEKEGSEVPKEVDPDLATRIIMAVERVRTELAKVDVKSCSVFKLEGKDEDKAKYGIVGNHVPWADILKSDLVYVYRLDDKLSVVRSEAVDPYTLLD